MLNLKRLKNHVALVAHPVELYMICACAVLIVLCIVAPYLIPDEINRDAATIDRRATMLAQKVCHTDSALCLAQQKAYSEIIEKVVSDPEATNRQLNEVEKTAQKESLKKALEQTFQTKK